MLFFVFNCRSQSYYFKHYQADQGLAQNTVITLMQDSRGFIWAGTKGGLSRFDGYAFKTFKNNKNKLGTIGDNRIWSIAEDHKGMIWVGTGRGLFKLDPYYQTCTELPQFSYAGIGQVLVDSSNNLWFLANGNVMHYNQQKNEITKTILSASCFAMDSLSNLWLGNNDGSISKYDILHKKLKKIQILDPALPINLKMISKILPDGGRVLVGTTKQGLLSYETSTGLVKSLLLRNPDNTEIFVRDIVSSGKEEFWLATESGIYIYNIKNALWQHLQKRPGDEYSLSDNAIYCLCKDNRNGYWAGTFFGGLNYFSKENAKFEKYYPVLGTNSISGDAVREICSDNQQNLWIGTEDAGINKFNPNTKTFTHYTTNGKTSGLSYPNIHGLLAVKDKLLVGPFQHGLEILDMKTRKVIHRFKLIGEKSKMNSDFVMCIYQTADSTLLIGTTGVGAGLFTFDPVKNTFKHLSKFPSFSYVYALLEDHEGTIWTGSLERGTFYFNPKTGQQGNIRFEEKIKNKSDNDYTIQGIFEDSTHALWFATEGGGLIRLDPDRKSFKKFTMKDGLPSNNLYRILEDKQKNLWISSLKGLICFNLETNRIQVYTKSNGLITNQFNYNSAYKASSGKMYFGSVKGMIAFNPDEFGQKEMAPPTYFTGLEINNKEIVPQPHSILKKSMEYMDSISLNYDQSTFSIEFAALNYASPNVTSYKYQMKGIDDDWIHLKSNRKAYFTELSPGKYTFILQAESNVGTWRGKEKTLFIVIHPPFWKSTIAYILYFFVSALAVYLAVRYYHRYLDKRALNRQQLFELAKNKEIYEAKIEFFTNIAHEIQTPLTLIIGPVERVMKKIEQAPGFKRSLMMIEKNANRLLELTAQLLDFRKTEMDQFGLNFVKTNIGALLKEQISGFKHEAERQHVLLSVTTPRTPVTAFIDKEAFVKICSNLVSNAIKYAGDKASVTLEPVQSGEETFKITFKNNGRPIPEELREKIFEPFYRVNGNGKPGTGIGLPLAKSLTELHHGSLKILPDPLKMSCFELVLPLHQQFEFNLNYWKKTRPND